MSDEVTYPLNINQFNNVGFYYIWDMLYNRDVDKAHLQVITETIYGALFNTNSNQSLLATTNVKVGSITSPADSNAIEAAIQADIDAITGNGGAVKRIQFQTVGAVVSWLIEYVS